MCFSCPQTVLTTLLICNKDFNCKTLSRLSITGFVSSGSRAELLVCFSDFVVTSVMCFVLMSSFLWDTAQYFRKPQRLHHHLKRNLTKPESYRRSINLRLFNLQRQFGLEFSLIRRLCVTLWFFFIT